MPDNPVPQQRPNYVQIAQRVLGQPLLMDRRYAQIFFSALGPRLGAEELRTLEGEVLLGDQMRLKAGSFSSDRERRRPYQIVEGIAVLPVAGTLVNKYGHMNPVSGMTGYDGIIGRVAEAQDDPDVEGVLLDIDSGGGEVAGFFDAVETLSILGQGKPLATLCYDMSCSAAQGIASVGRTRFITRNGTAGSIGVITAHRSYKDQLAEAGLKITLIYSGEHKADGNSFDDLPDDVLAGIQGELNDIRQEFATVVAANTGMSLQAVLDTEARTYRGQQAIDIGLATHMVNGYAAVAEFKKIIKAQRHSAVGLSQVGAEMSDETKPEAQEQGLAAPTAADERGRIQAILTSSEAEGRTDLANHLAFKTDMSAEAAEGILAASPKAEAPESEPEKDQGTGADLNASSETALDRAMAEEENPEITADAGGDGKVNAVDSMLASWSAATGQEVK